MERKPAGVEMFVHFEVGREGGAAVGAERDGEVGVLVLDGDEMGADLDVVVHLFFQFTLQGLGFRLIGLDFASWKFPFLGGVGEAAAASLHAEDFIVEVDYCGYYVIMLFH